MLGLLVSFVFVVEVVSACAYMRVPDNFKGRELQLTYDVYSPTVGCTALPNGFIYERLHSVPRLYVTL